MPSPFPGMDPYLEAPEIWHDLHAAFAAQISGALNSTLPSPYYARLGIRPEVGIADDGTPCWVIHGLGASRHIGEEPRTEAARILEAPRTAISKSLKVTVHNEPLRHAMVEIRDPTRSHRLVTLIEIVSPSNKRPGADRRAYLQKQGEVLDSDANLIELDLLRHGERLLSNMELEELVLHLDPPPDYLVLVNRAWQRVGDASSYEIFPVLLPHSLPVIPVPLRQHQEEVLLDLQFVFNRAYDSGPYRRGAVDYGQPPRPPLRQELVAWAEQRVREANPGQPPSST
jgi:Protein of unknown function (DUF4058)